VAQEAVFRARNVNRAHHGTNMIDPVRQEIIALAHTVVVKVGTNVVTQSDGKLDCARLQALADQLYTGGGRALVVLFCQADVWQGFRDATRRQVQDRLSQRPALHLPPMAPELGEKPVARRLAAAGKAEEPDVGLSAIALADARRHARHPRQRRPMGCVGHEKRRAQDRWQCRRPAGRRSPARGGS